MIERTEKWLSHVGHGYAGSVSSLEGASAWDSQSWLARAGSRGCTRALAGSIPRGRERGWVGCAVDSVGWPVV
jgi:hypothetical protein